MAIYSDDFEAYALGAHLPLGAWVQSGFFNSSVIAANYLPAGSKALEIPVGSGARYNDGLSYAGNTVYLPIKFSQTGYSVINFTDDSPITKSFLDIKVEGDGTLSSYVAGVRDKNSGDFSIHTDKWYWLQVNITMIDAAGFVGITYSVCIKGVGPILSNILVSGYATATTSSTFAAFNNITVGGHSVIDQFIFDSLKVDNTYPAAGTPKVRGGTGLVELLELVASAQVLASTGIVEVLELPTSANIRVSTGLIELLILVTPGSGNGAYVYEA